MRGLRTRGMLVSIAILMVFSGSLAFAQSQINLGLPWDGLVEFSGGSVAAGIGFSWGSGTLTIAGTTYPLKIEGLTISSVGITKSTAWGKVYNLKQPSDINGTYAAIGTGATVGAGGAGVTMKNEKGVVLDLYTNTEGVSFSLGAAGVKLELKQ
jgi:hypothetical protein